MFRAISQQMKINSIFLIFSRVLCSTIPRHPVDGYNANIMRSLGEMASFGELTHIIVPNIRACERIIEAATSTLELLETQGVDPCDIRVQRLADCVSVTERYLKSWMDITLGIHPLAIQWAGELNSLTNNHYLRVFERVYVNPSKVTSSDLNQVGSGLDEIMISNAREYFRAVNDVLQQMNEPMNDYADSLRSEMRYESSPRSSSEPSAAVERQWNDALPQDDTLIGWISSWLNW